MLVCVTSVLADGIVIAPVNRQVEETGQRAVIWWDGKKETLIVSTTYKGDTADFAWVIPVPSRPEVTTSKDELFVALNQYTTLNSVDTYPKPLGFGYIGSNIDVRTGVTVYETKRVDVYDISVLSAKSTWELRQWLQTRGYAYPSDREHLLSSYVNKGWYFVAVKVADDSVNYAGSGLREGHPTPIKITFNTDQAIYPLKISGAKASVPTPTPYYPYLPGTGVSYPYGIEQPPMYIMPPTPAPVISGKVIAGFSFEYSLGNWNKYSNPTQDLYLLGGTIQVSKKEAKFGSSSVEMSGVKKPGDLYVYQAIPNLAVGKKYIYSAYVKANAKQGTVRLKVQRVGYASEWESARFQVSSLKEWTRIELPFYPLYDNYEFDLIVNGMNEAGKVYWDGVQVEQGEVATSFYGEKAPSWMTNTRDYCMGYDGDINGCDSTSYCAYYYCSNQCWPEGTPNKTACPGQDVSYLQDQAQNLVLYVFADHKQMVPGWNTEYAGWVSAKDIKNLAIDDTGGAWIENDKKRYLTKLTRVMNPREMVDDVVFRNASNDKAEGVGKGGWSWAWPGKASLLFGATLLAEVGIIAYIVKRKRKK